MYGEYYRLRRTLSPKKKIATWLIFGFVVGHTLHQENAHSCSHNDILYATTTKKGTSTHTQNWTQMVLDEHENKSCPSHYQYGCLFRDVNDQVQPIPQPVRHTCPALYSKGSSERLSEKLTIGREAKLRGQLQKF